jgi:multimeric flavodoxin WrbA
MTAKNVKKALGIVGSPRRGGNTDVMVDHVLQGAREAGAEIEKIMLSDLSIAPCRACYSCQDAGICVHKDDMESVFEKMDESRVWVLGTPVYWWGPSAQMKTFVDRWFAKAASRDRRDILSGHKVVLAVPMGDTDPATARHVIGMFQDALSYVRSEIVATILAPGAYDIGDVEKQTGVLDEARRAGRKAVGRD